MESQNNFGVRKISWIISLEIGFAIRKTYTIYPITNNDRTLIKLSLELIHPENNEPIKFDETRDYYYKLQSNLISKISNLMDKSNDFLFIHQSFIIKKVLETCWTNIINFELLSSATSGEIGESFTNNDDPEKVGTFWKCFMKKYNKYIYFRVKKVIKSKKRNRWTYCVETFGVNLFIIKQELEISVTKINHESCQISILVKFGEKIDKKLYNYKKEKLNEYVKKIKSFLDRKRY